MSNALPSHPKNNKIKELDMCSVKGKKYEYLSRVLEFTISGSIEVKEDLYTLWLVPVALKCQTSSFQVNKKESEERENK